MANQTKLFVAVLTFLCVPYLIVIAATFGNPSLLVSFFPDDAFYYLQTAYTFAHTGAVSFDGVNPTTGFHPLHFGIAAAAYLFLDKAGSLQFFLLWIAIALGFSCYVLLRAYSAGLKVALLSTIATLPVLTLYLFTSSGLESATLLIAWTALYFLLIHTDFSRQVSAARAVLVGSSMGLVLLSRLDMVIPLGIIGLFLLQQAITTKQFMRFALIAITGLLIVGPYLVWLYDVQGTIVPISSIAKYGRERWEIAQIFRALTGGSIFGLLLLILPLSIVAMASVRFFSARDQQQRILFFCSVSAIAYFAYIVFLAHEPFRWYLNFIYFVAINVLLWQVSHLSLAQIQLRTAYLIASACLIVDTAALYAWSRTETTSSGLLELTRQLNLLIPPEARLATNDAGVVGFHARFQVHNLDGLINSYDNWEQYLKRGDYAGYASKYGINYLLLRNEIAEAYQQEVLTSGSIHLTQIAQFDVPRFGREILLKLD